MTNPGKEALIESVRHIVRNSGFNKVRYNVDVDLDFFPASLERMCLNKNINDDSFSLNIDLNEKFSPKFQRCNDKWSKQRKKLFIQNIIKGFKSEILLYTTEDEYKKRGYFSGYLKILDGLQRATAIYDFHKGKVKPFGLTLKELKDNRVIGMCTTISFRVLVFKTEIEAVEFYIDMNKGISHSKADIVKAEKYLEILTKTAKFDKLTDK